MGGLVLYLHVDIKQENGFPKFLRQPETVLRQYVQSFFFPRELWCDWLRSETRSDRHFRRIRAHFLFIFNSDLKVPTDNNVVTWRYNHIKRITVSPCNFWKCLRKKLIASVTVFSISSALWRSKLVIAHSIGNYNRIFIYYKVLIACVA